MTTSTSKESLHHVLAEMRGNEFDDPHLNCDGMIGARRLARDWADRIEAAWKRVIRDYELEKHLAYHDGSQTALKVVANLSEGQVSIGNSAALRDALLCILNIAERDMPNYCRSRARDQGESESIRAWSNTIVELVKNALSKPSRQCDVGSVEEQYKRFRKFCKSNKELAGSSDCAILWGQMPYEESASEESEKEEPEFVPPLSPCPKCGSTTVRLAHPAFDGGAYGYCPECHFSPQTETWAPTDAKSAVKWNEMCIKEKGGGQVEQPQEMLGKD